MRRLCLRRCSIGTAAGRCIRGWPTCSSPPTRAARGRTFTGSRSCSRLPRARLARRRRTSTRWVRLPTAVPRQIQFSTRALSRPSSCRASRARASRWPSSSSLSTLPGVPPARSTPQPRSPLNGWRRLGACFSPADRHSRPSETLARRGTATRPGSASLSPSGCVAEASIRSPSRRTCSSAHASCTTTRPSSETFTSSSLCYSA
mmetsp:Transcript_26624/g.79446  ORF Transcript_26624/g.79446 Transcript_26624/m.79446 type:complete len:204 (-) Transcript_26624:2570-3181(-)